MDWIEFRERVASIFFPQRCVFCDDVVAYDDYWCAKCENAGLPFARLGNTVETELPDCITDAVAAFEYSGKIRSLILRLKDKPERRTVNFFTDEMLSAMSKRWRDVTFDTIVPVPTTATKLKQRGFNQAELLARRISAGVEVPLRGDALMRLEDTRTQHDLSASQRRINAAKSYDIRNAEGLDGNTVLLVDDVLTTGATVVACANKLLGAGVSRVYVATTAETRYNQ